MRARLLTSMLVGGLVLLLSAPVASAYYGPNPINDPASRTALVGLLDTRGDALELLIDPALTTDQQKELRGRITRARAATGRLPAIGKLFGRVSIGASAVAVGYQVAHDTGVGEYIAGWITGYTAPASSGVALLQKLELNQDVGSDAYGCTYGAFFGNNYYYPYGTLSGGPSFPYQFSDTGGGPEAIYNALLGWAATAGYSVVDKLGNDAALPQTSCTTNIYNVNPGFHFFGVPLTEVKQGLNVDVFEDSGTTPDVTLSAGDWSESTGDPGETAEITEARAQLEGTTADDTDPVAVAAGQLIDPAWEGYVETEPQPLLKPLPNETYTAYIARLTTEGLIGSHTSTEESTEIEGYGPEAVTRVSYPNGGTTVVLDPLSWPTSDPLIPPDTVVTVRYNPDTAPPVPTEGAGTGGVCDCPPLDMTPITELDYGQNFPFGMFTWLGDSWEAMTGADAECMTGTFDKPTGGEITVELCSELWEDTYRPILFAGAQFVMVCSLIIFFATKFLGVRGSSDDD